MKRKYRKKRQEKVKYVKNKRNRKYIGKGKGGIGDIGDPFDFIHDPAIELQRQYNLPKNNVLKKKIKIDDGFATIKKKPLINSNRFPKMSWQNRKSYKPPPIVYNKAKGVIGNLPMRSKGLIGPVKSKGLIGKFPMGKTGMKAAGALAGVAALSGAIAAAIDKAK